MGCSLTLLIILQVYIMLTFRTIQWIYLCQVAFSQHHKLTWSISPLNYKFFPPTCTERTRENFNEAGGRKSSQPGTIIWGLLGLIRESLDASGFGQVNIHVMSETFVNTYACIQQVTSFLSGRELIGLTDPWWIVRDCWSCYQGGN